jgi:hypothetical protein
VDSSSGLTLFFFLLGSSTDMIHDWREMTEPLARVVDAENVEHLRVVMVDTESGAMVKLYMPDGVPVLDCAGCHVMLSMHVPAPVLVLRNE